MDFYCNDRYLTMVNYGGIIYLLHFLYTLVNVFSLVAYLKPTTRTNRTIVERKCFAISPERNLKGILINLHIMIWMETYFLYCSVRLGVIVIGILSFLSLFIPAILFFVLGVRVLDPILHLFQNDDYYKKNYVVSRFNHWIQNSPQNFMILLQLYFFVHMLACLLAIYGAIKLQRWLLFPLIVLEFMRVIYCLTCHIVLMIVLKKIINLGVLIALTLAGGFLILYLAYNWAACAALFQIIHLIHTQRYRKIYGEDPFHPHVPEGGLPSYDSIENVRVLDTPNPQEVDDLKNKYSNSYPNNVRSPQTVISVLPASQNQDRVPIVSKRDRERQKHQFADEKGNQLAAKNADQPEAYYYNDLVVDYNNWQWAELMGVSKKQQNALIGTDWKRY